MFRTLILDQSYNPFQVVDWKDAVTKMFNGKLEIIAQYDEVLAHLDERALTTFPKLRKALRQVIPVDVTSIEVKVPAVGIQRMKTQPKRKAGMRFSPENVRLRDKFTCQYCGKKPPLKELNRDHVIPRSQGGKTNWTNIVTSCIDCNSRKGGATPEQAGMKLLVVPVQPQSLPLRVSRQALENAPEEWAPFLQNYSFA